MSETALEALGVVALVIGAAVVLLYLFGPWR